MANKILAALFVNAAVFSALFLLMLPVRRLLGKRLSPAAQLVLWAVLALKLVIPFGFESRLSLLPPPRPAALEAAQTGAALPGALQAARQPYGGSPEPQAPEPGSAQIDASAPASEDQDVSERSGQASAAGRPLDPALLLLGIWAAGALAVSAALWAGAAALRRRVRHGRADVPAHVFHAFGECGRALGIRRGVSLAVSRVPGVPAAMGAMRPALVLPEDAGRLDGQALRHVLLHELAHIRRGDLWILRLMNALCAVYWFAPPVWLCCRLVRADIETACDHTVLRTIGQGQRLAYVSTVLRFTGRRTPGQLAAAMGMSDGRPAMEKRIAGLYRSARTDTRGRLLAAAVALLLLSASALTACQPTPSEAYVKNKNDDSFLNQLITPGGATGGGVSTAAEGATVAPGDNIFAGYAKNWTATIQVKPHPITVSINADVVTPVAAGLPVYTVVPEKLTQERIDGFLSQFGGVQYHLDMSEIKTKSYYQEQILQIQALLAKLPDNQEYTEEQRKRQQKDLENGIRLMQQDMQSAPDGTDDVIEPRFTGKYIIARDSAPGHEGADEGDPVVTPNPETAKEIYESTHTESIDVKWTWNDVSMALHASRSDDLWGNGFSFMAARGAVPAGGDALSAASATTNIVANTADLEGFHTTFAQAKALAEDAVAKLGVDYMSVAHSAKEIRYADLQHAVNYTDTSHFTDFGKLEYKDLDYVFYFTRRIGGVNETYCSNFIAYNKQLDEPWPYERLCVVVDDSGVKEIGWQSSGSKLGGQIASDSRLLPFDQVQKIAGQQFADGNIRINNSFDENAYVGFYKSLVRMEINIDRVVLGYARVKLSDNSGRYALVPVWDFFGNNAYYDDADPNQPARIKYSMEREGIYDYAMSYLTINAIDGSVIDRSLGY